MYVCVCAKERLSTIQTSRDQTRERRGRERNDNSLVVEQSAEAAK